MNICYSPGILDEMNIRKGFREFMKVAIKNEKTGRRFEQTTPENAHTGQQVFRL